MVLDLPPGGFGPKVPQIACTTPSAAPMPSPPPLGPWDTLILHQMMGLPRPSGTGVFPARDVPAPLATGVSNIRGGKASKLHSLLTLGASFIWVPRQVGGWV